MDDLLNNGSWNNNGWGVESWNDSVWGDSIRDNSVRSWIDVDWSWGVVDAEDIFTYIDNVTADVDDTGFGGKLNEGWL